RSRRAVGDDGQEQHTIRTVPRYGFRWLAEVAVETVVDEPAAPSAAPEPSARPREPALPQAAATTATTAPAAAEAGEDNAPPSTDPSRSPRASGRRRWIAAIAIALALALAVLAWSQRDRDTAPAPTPVADATPADAPRALMVLPTQVDDPGDASWARLGLMDFIGDRLHRSGLPVLPSETTLGVMHRQDGDDPRRLRRAARAKWVV